MTQSSLLELARNGNPQAIASLMNQVLEPKGVVAKTQVEGTCLHIVFLSEHLLSQSAIASFVKNGLNALSPKTFQTIKLYAQKIGQDSPLWIDSFSLEQAILTSPPPLPTPAASSKVNRAASSPATVPPVRPKPPATLPKVNLSAHSGGTSSRPQPPLRTRLAKRKTAAIARFIQQTTYRLRTIHVANYLSRYPVTIAVSASAFLIGGTAALIFYTQAKSSSEAVDTAQGEATLPLSSQSLVSSAPVPADNPSETQVESYLMQMNKAQATFHQTHGRFAATLEELERSAAIMSHSTHYTYRLVLRENTQAVLTATPKQEGLKSYSGTVLLTTVDPASATTTIICKTNQPSVFPPILAQAAVAPILCPVDSTQVPG